MVKIAIAGASGGLAREIIDKLVETQKHEIIAMVRRDPAQFPSFPGVEWTQTNYEHKSELVGLFKGVETVLVCFAVHLDQDNATQKRLIDAAVEAGVKRLAPSEWATGVKLEGALHVIPWYANKVEIAHYLEKINEKKKVIEYTRFQIGAFMNYLGHPHQTSKHIKTLDFSFSFEKQHAMLIEGSLDDVMTWTTVEDIAVVVARAVEYQGEWPTIGGIRGTTITLGEMLQLGEQIGRPFTVDWIKKDAFAQAANKFEFDKFDLNSASPEEIATFLDVATKGILVGIGCGAYAVTDEWNRLLPDYEFTQVGDFVKKVWAGR